jgi:hypothetical protein
LRRICCENGSVLSAVSVPRAPKHLHLINVIISTCRRVTTHLGSRAALQLACWHCCSAAVTQGEVQGYVVSCWNVRWRPSADIDGIEERDVLINGRSKGRCPLPLSSAYMTGRRLRESVAQPPLQPRVCMLPSIGTYRSGICIRISQLYSILRLYDLYSELMQKKSEIFLGISVLFI